MDEADRASEEEERSLLEAARKRQPVGPPPTGRCHWCDEIVDDNDRWCSIDCREDWDRETLLRRNRGLR